ncbi:FecR family protein [Sphingobacterium hotanense]|uniref:FecR family protein n=1 Tax=Sphingobacterium hotanense TaxID=649196 RepID=UPI0021A5D7C0|nr:FecR domain-containing protein [Sphingobacterium hotanense]MCT1523859.1 FecR domain-containing protein [Sphingobacterium hotanense]
MEEAERLLLHKFLTGFCTEEEHQSVRELLDSAEGRNLLDELMREREMQAWDSPKQPDPSMQQQVQQKLAEMQKRITTYEEEQQGPLAVKGRVIRWQRVFRYAAIFTGFLMLTGLAVWQFNQQRSAVTNTAQYTEKTNTQGIPVRYVLPDSTEVFLAAGSTLKYPEGLAGKQRIVLLEGEAFFDVTPNKDKPFIIRTGEVETRVLGTSFKVSAFDGHPLEVAVATGKVGVSRTKGTERKELAYLTPGRRVSWNRQTDAVTESNVEVAELVQWKAGDLIFNEQPMEEVAAILERRFGAGFRFADEASRRVRVSGTFTPEESVEGVVDMLSFVGKFNYQLSSDKQFITIKKQGK